MTVFKKYATVYDLLYKDKDYTKEADHIADILKKFGDGKIKKVLNLGCGTGRHDHILAKMGYEMTGVDMSGEMVEIANLTPGPSPKREGGKEPLSFRRGKEGEVEPCFFVGDIRTIDLNRKFDAVISMFHVMSYQNKDSDVEAVFGNAFRHLTAGGIFLFDCWYGPAVLNERPGKRVKNVENDELVVTRYAVPVLHEDTHVVDVNYEINVIEKKSGHQETFTETHNMRYFSVPELEKFAVNAGFEMISHEINGWNLEITVRKR